MTDMVSNLQKLKDSLLSAQSSDNKDGVRSCLKKLSTCSITKDALLKLDLGRVIKSLMKEYPEAGHTKAAWVKTLGTIFFC